MSQIGTVVTNTEVPAAPSIAWDTANAFVVGLADWGPEGAPVTIKSPAGVAPTVGPRSGTNANAYDGLDIYFREGGRSAIFSRVTGPGASAASLVLSDANGSASLLVQAVYVGNYGNQLQLTTTNNGGSFTIGLTDTYGNALAQSPPLTNKAAAVSWATAIGGYIDIVAYATASGLPATHVAQQLTGGTDDRANVALTHWQNALGAFPYILGPGQVFAPGQTNSTLPGIWATLGQHALLNNRAALADMDDGVSALVLVSEINAFGHGQGLGPVGFWAGNLAAPGTVPGTTRSIPPSPVIAALCARVDSTGNQNLAAAGSSFPLQYCTGSFTLVSGTTETYNANDVSVLNDAGINTFATRFGVFENFGFVSNILPTTDVIYWEFNHIRLRMALTADVQIVAEPFLFSQLDGQGSDILAFATAITNLLSGYFTAGALFGATSSQAFAVNTGPTVNTPTTLQQGQLNAVLSVRMSPFAQLIQITINSVPITQPVPAGNTTSAATQ
jgi:hypothetical protein